MGDPFANADTSVAEELLAAGYERCVLNVRQRVAAWSDSTGAPIHPPFWLPAVEEEEYPTVVDLYCCA